MGEGEERGGKGSLRTSRKPEALWKMKAAKNAGEEYYDPKREDNIF